MSDLQFLKDLMGKPVYEIYAGRTYSHTVEGFTIDSTGIYILLKDGGVLHAANAYLKGKQGMIPIAVMIS